MARYFVSFSSNFLPTDNDQLFTIETSYGSFSITFSLNGVPYGSADVNAAVRVYPAEEAQLVTRLQTAVGVINNGLPTVNLVASITDGADYTRGIHLNFESSTTPVFTADWDYTITDLSQGQLPNPDFTYLQVSSRLSNVPTATPCTTLHIEFTANNYIKSIGAVNYGGDSFIELYEVNRDDLVSLSGLVLTDISDNDFNLYGVYTGLAPIISSYITVNTNPNSKIINVDVYNPSRLRLEFSLDGSNYQFYNSFIVPSSGNKTIYVKDNYGCVVSKAFVMPNYIGEGIEKPILPKDNPFRFKQLDNFLPNDNNLLSCEGLDEINYKEIQRFDKNDKVKLQVKALFTPKLYIDYDVMPFVKITNFKGQKLRLNAKYKHVNSTAYKDGYTLVYFTTGDYLNYDTGADIGDYTLLGQLPEWADKNRVMKLSADNFATSYDTFVQDVYFDQEINAYVLKCIDSVFTGSGDIEIKVEYDLHPYEVYEVEVDMANYVNSEVFQARVNVFNGNDQFNFVSEYITVGIEDNMRKIEYYMDRNTEMYYASGIKNILWAFVKSSSAVDEVSVDNFMGDDDIYPIEPKVYEVEKIVFDSPSKEVARKLVYALACTNVYINNERVIAKDVSMEQNGATNLYIVNATMYKVNEFASVEPVDTVLDPDVIAYANSILISGKLYDMTCTNEFYKKLKN